MRGRSKEWVEGMAAVMVTVTMAETLLLPGRNKFVSQGAEPRNVDTYEIVPLDPWHLSGIFERACG